MTAQSDAYVQVLYDFAYTDDKGREIKIKRGEELLVVHKSDSSWWQVIRNSEKCPFYAPSCYLEVINNLPNDNLNHEDENANVEHEFCNSLVEQNVSADVDLSNASSHHMSSFIQPKNNQAKPVYSLAFQNPLCADENETISANSSYESLQNSSSQDITELYDSGYQQSPLSEKKASMPLNQTTDLPIYANIPLSTRIRPPNPGADDVPERELPNGWFEYVDDNCRKYYYHSSTRKVTWKPPRRSENNLGEVDQNLNESFEKVPEPPPKQLKPKLQKIAHSSSESLDSPTSSYMFTILPPGWTQECDVESGIIYYKNEASQKKWYTSQDENGRTYFYDEDSSESFWELPDVLHASSKKKEDSEDTLIATSVPSDVGALQSFKDSPKLRNKKAPKLPVSRQCKTQSMVIADTVVVLESDEKTPVSPSLNCILYSGQLNKTKLVDGGRRVRKNWAASYVVLTDACLLFYKDARSANSVW